jgi:predicted aldo/keto reductase-like oxidoreductase
MALNAAEHQRFRELALPAAVGKRMGVIAMKVTRNLVGEGPGKASAASLLRWAWDLPVATAIVGMESLTQLNENLRLAAAYRPGADAAEAGPLARRLFAQVTREQLGWAVPGYRDA